MFESDKDTENFIQKTLSVPLIIDRNGKIVKLYDFTLYSGHRLYQGNNKGQAKL